MPPVTHKTVDFSNFIFVCFCVYSVFRTAQSMLSHLAYFWGQKLVHLCLFVLLSLMSRIDNICTVVFEQINDDDDDDDD